MFFSAEEPVPAVPLVEKLGLLPLQEVAVERLAKDEIVDYGVVVSARPSAPEALNHKSGACRGRGVGRVIDA